MNARQAAKAAAKQIEELENYNARCKADITAYNQCIRGMIAGESPCRWCEEHEECQLEAKDGKGCDDWWLKYCDVVTEDEDDSKGIYGTSSEGRGRT